MRIKKFVADTAKEALLQVREEMGPSAVILKTQRAPSKSMLGIWGKGKVEVTAALDENLYVKPESTPNSGLSDLKVYNRKGETQSAEPAMPRRETGLTDEKFRIAEIHEDVEEVKAVLRNLAEQLRNHQMPPLPEVVGRFCSRLMDQEVNKEIAVKIGLRLQGALDDKALDDEKKVEAKARELLATGVQTSGPFALKDRRAARIMFVGPTGAGKTTTLAKLAAQYGIIQRRRIRVITADTYRIAAVEQLKVFAEISDIPMEVVFTPEEMRRAVARMSASSDIILIDTAGRSQNNAEHMDDLQLLVEAAEPDELHLVLSASTKESDLFAAANRYRLLGVNRYIFTKLDETQKYGALYNLLSETKTPLSYLTAGQSVPDDIEEAGTVKLVEWMLKTGRPEPAMKA